MDTRVGTSWIGSLVLFAAGVAAAPAHAQEAGLRYAWHLTDDQPGPTTEYGRSVAVSENGHWAVGQPAALPQFGFGWVLHYLPEEGFLGIRTYAAGGRFGEAVALDGDQLAVGAPAETFAGLPEAGAVYAFQTLGALGPGLHPSDADAFDRFGSAVAVEGDTFVASSPYDGADVGAAYVFVRVGSAWIEQAKLVAPDAADGDLFGASVALDGDTVLVGAPGDDTAAGADAGSAYVFVRSGTSWPFEQKLEPAHALAGGAFGCAVALDGGIAAVGAKVHETAHVFERAGTLWSELVELLPELPGPTGFGSAVAVRGDRVLVGAPLEDDGEQEALGAVYAYVRDGATWSRWERVVAPPHANSPSASPHAFGAAVAAAGELVVACAPGGKDAHVFELVDYPIVVQDTKLASAGAAAGDRYGEHLAADDLGGARVAVAARAREAGAVQDAGAVVVLERTPGGWAERAVLFASAPVAGGTLATSVALDGDTLVAGAALDDELGTNAGAAYVFVKQGAAWSEQAKLLAPDGLQEDRFGWSVAVDGDRLAVGAQREDNGGGQDAGAVYVYGRDGTAWTFEQKLLASDGHGGDNFGVSVALRADTLAVGAWRAPPRGRAYVFERQGGTWNEVALLSSAGPETRFGTAVDLDGDRLAVGAPFPTVAQGSGAVYLFQRSGTAWLPEATLHGVDSRAPDDFGAALDLSGSRLAVAAREDAEVRFTHSGMAYLFEHDGAAWSLERKLKPEHPASQERAGSAIALAGGAVLIGSYEDPDAPASGSVYVYELDERFPSFCDASDVALASCPCKNPGAPDAGCDLQQATGGIALAVAARTTEPLNRATLVGTGFPPTGTPGVAAIRAPALDAAAPVVFGDGLRCIAVPLVRVGASNAVGGVASLTVGHGAAAGAGTFYYQLWVRNTPAMFCDPVAGFNLSNGRALTW